MLLRPLLQEHRKTPMMQATTSLSLTHLGMMCLPGPFCFLTRSQRLAHAESLVTGDHARPLWSAQRCVGAEVRAPHAGIPGRLIVAGFHGTVMEVRKLRRSAADDRPRRTGQSVGHGALPRGAEGRTV